MNGHVPQIPNVPISGLAVTLEEAASLKQSYEAMRLPRPQRLFRLARTNKLLADGNKRVRTVSRIPLPKVSGVKAFSIPRPRTPSRRSLAAPPGH